MVWFGQIPQMEKYLFQSNCMKAYNNLERKDKLHRLLMQVPDIVDSFSKRDISASAKWIEWLKISESTLKEYNYSECSQLSGLRSSIISSQLSTDADSSRRKHVDKVCLSTIEPSQQIITKIHDSLNSKIEIAYSLFRQVLVPMRENKLVSMDNISDTTEYISTLLRQLCLNEQLSANINGIIATIGKTDTVKIIEEILTEKL